MLVAPLLLPLLRVMGPRLRGPAYNLAGVCGSQRSVQLVRPIHVEHVQHLRPLFRPISTPLLPHPLLPLLVLLLLRLRAAARLRPHGDLIFCWAAIDCFRGFFSFSSTGSLTLVWLQSWSVSKPWSSLLRLHLFRRGRCSIMPIDAVGTDDANQQDRKRR